MDNVDESPAEDLHFPCLIAMTVEGPRMAAWGLDTVHTPETFRSTLREMRARCWAMLVAQESVAKSQWTTVVTGDPVHMAVLESWAARAKADGRPRPTQPFPETSPHDRRHFRPHVHRPARRRRGEGITMAEPTVPPTAVTPEQLAAMGRVLNLLATDAHRLANRAQIAAITARDLLVSKGLVSEAEWDAALERVEQGQAVLFALDPDVQRWFDEIQRLLRPDERTDPPIADEEEH